MSTEETIQSMQASLNELKAEEHRIGRAVSQLEQLLVGLQEAPMGKRRGRPPGKKNATSKAASIGGKPKSGKRRGRPPGKKNATADSSASVEGRTGKRRGRPPGKKATSKVMGSVVKKKRGRPPKVASAWVNAQSIESEMA